MFFVFLNETLFFFFVFLTENCKFSKKNYDCVDFADVGCFDNGIFVVQEKCVGVNFFFFFHLQDFFCAFINFFHVKNFFWLVMMFFLYSSNFISLGKILLNFSLPTIKNNLSHLDCMSLFHKKIFCVQY